MVEENGAVVALSQDGVWVETVRQSACGQCAARHGCGQRVLASLGDGQRFRVRALNPSRLALQVGDRVRLGMAETAFLKASLLVYLVPLLGMVGGALLADLWLASEGAVALAGLLGLALGLMVVYGHGRLASRNCEYQPVILKVLAAEPERFGGVIEVKQESGG